jgi:hypothetical protein
MCVWARVCVCACVCVCVCVAAVLCVFARQVICAAAFREHDPNINCRIGKFKSRGFRIDCILCRALWAPTVKCEISRILFAVASAVVSLHRCSFPVCGVAPWRQKRKHSDQPQQKCNRSAAAAGTMSGPSAATTSSAGSAAALRTGSAATIPSEWAAGIQ